MLFLGFLDERLGPLLGSFSPTEVNVARAFCVVSNNRCHIVGEFDDPTADGDVINLVVDIGAALNPDFTNCQRS